MDLGRLVSVHRGTWTGWALGIVAGVAMTIGIWWARSAMRPSRPTTVLLIAIGFTLVTLVLIVVAWRNAATRISVHEHGIAWSVGSRLEVLRFDEIASVHEWEVNGKTSAIIIWTHRQKEVRLPGHVTDREALVATLAARQRPAAALPVARAR
jgi:hypothetical protein